MDATIKSGGPTVKTIEFRKDTYWLIRYKFLCLGTTWQQLPGDQARMIAAWANDYEYSITMTTANGSTSTIISGGSTIDGVTAYEGGDDCPRISYQYSSGNKFIFIPKGSKVTINYKAFGEWNQDCTITGTYIYQDY